MTAAQTQAIVDAAVAAALAAVAGTQEKPTRAKKSAPVKPTVRSCFKVRGDAKKLDGSKYARLSLDDALEIMREQYAAGQCYATHKS